jgi:OOP family OmpA-OmpF porin
VFGASVAACASAQDKAACYPLASWSAPVFRCGDGGASAGAGAGAITTPDVAATRPPPVAAPEPVRPPPAPEPEPAAPPPKVTVKKDKIEVSETVQFEADSATLTDRSRQVLDEIASQLADHPEVKKVQIESYTAPAGTKRQSLKLTQDRAAAVKSYLANKGVEAKRLTTKAFGDTKPIASNKSEEGRAKNRRVEFRVLRK